MYVKNAFQEMQNYFVINKPISKLEVNALKLINVI